MLVDVSVVETVVDSVSVTVLVVTVVGSVVDVVGSVVGSIFFTATAIIEMSPSTFGILIVHLSSLYGTVTSFPPICTFTLSILKPSSGVNVAVYWLPSTILFILLSVTTFNNNDETTKFFFSGTVVDVVTVVGSVVETVVGSVSVTVLVVVSVVETVVGSVTCSSAKCILALTILSL